MKVFTDESKPKHPLIKLLKESGHTGITISINSAMDGHRGVYATTDQCGYSLIGYSIKSAIKKLTKDLEAFLKK